MRAISSALRSPSIIVRLLPALAFALLGVPSSPSWAECMDYGGFMRWIGDAPLPEATIAPDIAVSDALAYVLYSGTGWGGMLIIDISDPDAPVILSDTILPESPCGVQAVGSAVCIACGDAGLQILDATEPTAPILIGSVATPAKAMGVAVRGSLVYLACRQAGVVVVDASNPASPQILGVRDTLGWASGIVLQGDFAYVADYALGLQILNLADPEAPTLSGRIDTPGYAKRLAVRGSMAFIADGVAGLQVIDVSAPISPHIVGALSIDGDATHIALAGDRAFLADEDPGKVRMIDIADPTEPGFVQDLPAMEQCHAVMVRESLLLVAESAETQPELNLFDISSTDSAPMLWTGDIDHPQDVAVREDRLYVTSLFDLQAFDISDPRAPAFLGMMSMPGWCEDLESSGSVLYALSTDFGGGLPGVSTYDMSAPGLPVALDMWVAPDHATAIAIDGDRVYVGADASWPQGVTVILDAADPADLRQVGSYVHERIVNSVTADFPYAYVTIAGGRLEILDVSDPSSPNRISSWALGVSRVYRAWDGILLAGSQYGLHVLDVADPENVFILTEVHLPSWTYEVAWDGRFAYVGDGGGTFVIDLASPGDAAITGSAHTGTADGVVKAGDYLYVADSPGGLRVAYAQCAPMSVSDPLDAGGGELRPPVLFPNPATRGPISLAFETPGPGRVSLTVYDPRGRAVARPIDEWADAGGHTARWEGIDALGRPAPAGSYFVRLRWRETMRTTAFVLLR